MQIDGPCHGGLVSFNAEVHRSQVVACHCTNCKVSSGAPFRSIATSSIERIALLNKRSKGRFAPFGRPLCEPMRVLPGLNPSF